MDSIERSINLEPVRGRHVLVALSGGADSVALLLLLKENGVNVSAAHFEHGMRGEASIGDMEFCERLSKGLGVPFFCERGDVPNNRVKGEGLEAAARRLRYQFLSEAGVKAGTDVLATAHHADDQAETVLMHLLRGAGSRGAKGMRIFENGIYRPLLGMRKTELEEYLMRRGMSWREDATNRVPDTPRNALRLDALPKLEAIYPGAVHALCRFAQTQAVEDDFIREESVRWFSDRCFSLSFGEFYRLDPMPPEAILRRLFCLILGKHASYEHVMRMLMLVQSPHGRISLPDEKIAEKTERGLFIISPQWVEPAATPLNLNGETKLANLATFQARSSAPVPVRDNPFKQVVFRGSLDDAVVRVWQEGDFIYPLGMRGKKLLSDYLMDKKIERPLRAGIPLVARGREVLWVVGLGISANSMVEEGMEAVELTCHFEDDFGEIFMGGTKA